MTLQKVIAVIFATFSLLAHGHLGLLTPFPVIDPNFGNGHQAQYNPVLPPSPGSSNTFPCNGLAPPSTGGVQMPVGSKQSLVIDDRAGSGTATHGGGSCQISISYAFDLATLSKPMSWYVISSIEHGCPSNTVDNLWGNFASPLGGIYNGSHQCSEPITNGIDCLNDFTFDIPKGLMNGNAVLAWTWYNTIGNREMYMNCVAVEITGGETDDSQMQNLPGLFIANDGTSCVTSQNVAVAFPYPGPHLTIRAPSPKMALTEQLNTWPLVTPSGCPDVARSGRGAGPGATITESGSPRGSSGGDANRRVTINAVTSDAQKPKSTTGAAAVGHSVHPGAFDERPASPKGTHAAPGAGGSCPAGSVSCSTPGSVVCPDSSHFGLCDINNCAVSQAVAAGTQCKNGAVTWADPAKRDEPHIHQRHPSPHAASSGADSS